MGLRLKFNLVLVIIFAAGFVTVGTFADRYLQQDAVDHAKRTANLVQDLAGITNIDTSLAGTLGSRIVEMKVRSFNENETQSGIYADVAQRLLSIGGGVRNELTEIFVLPTGAKKLIVARLVRIADAQARITVVMIDHSVITATALLALTTFMSSLAAVFFAAFFALNVMLDRMIVRPVAEMANLADAISVGNFSIPEFKPHSKDEIGTLGVAFNRMRRSTEEAIKMLKVG